MTREEKNQLIDSLADQLASHDTIYLADISDLDSEVTTKLRGLCYKRDVKMTVVKNTLLKKAMEKTEKDFEPLFAILKGNTSVMFSEVGNVPAKLIKEFRKKSDRPILKGAYVEEMTYIGDDQLDFLASIKSKNELIGDLVGLLQSPIRNVMGALSSGGNTLSGILTTLSEKSE
jgi:large subunit ribosomal protein L10